MSVGIIFSTTNGGSAITDDVDHGSGNNGSTLTAQTIHIRHTGVNSITGVKFYIAAYDESYSGGTSAIDDLAELIAWGDNSTALGFGGFQLNMDAAHSFISTSWPTYSSKSPSYGAVCRTGVGDNSTNAITLSSQSGATSDGVIQAGTSPNVRFKCRIVIPSNEDTTGIRQFDQYMLYNYTS
jgi:hypothetical protein